MNQFPARGVTEVFRDAKEYLGFLKAERAYLKERLGALDSGSPFDSWNLDVNRPIHAVVVPHEGNAFDSFAPARGNFYYESAQSLRELLGPECVSIFHVAPGESADVWHSGLLDFIKSVGATHVLGHIESDPGQVNAPWTWDSLWFELSAAWDGVLLGVTFDSSHRWLAARSRLLARISDRFLLLDICIPMDGRMVRGRPEVGPIPLVLSRESQALLTDRLIGVTPEFDLSFIGSMYPYRVALVEQLRAAGVSVAVNPHRSDTAEDLESSRRDQPSWLDYMAGLASSRMTLNFSQSTAGRYEQFKWRVMEAGLAGTLLLTDDRDRTSRFFLPEVEYGYFPNVKQFPKVLSEYMSDPQRVARVAAAGARKAQELAPEGLWRAVDFGLHRRKLRSLGIV